MGWYGPMRKVPFLEVVRWISSVSIEKGLLVPKIGLANPFALRSDLELISLTISICYKAGR